MKTPDEAALDRLMHVYDPKKAHEYYLRNRELTGRKPGAGKVIGGTSEGQDVVSGRTPAKKVSSAKAKQRQALAAQIQNMEQKLKLLEELIRKKMHAEAGEDRKGKAKKERAAKEKDKPKSAAEKAKLARENEKYREKHKQELKSKSKQASGSSSKSDTTKPKGSTASVSDLKALATKVKGQIAIAKTKLAAL